MENTKAAFPYIKSLLGLAVEQGALEQVHVDMQNFSKVCEDNRAFKLMLRNPVIKHDKKLMILKKVFEGKVQDLTMRIFEIITRKNREPLLPAIAQGFHRAYQEHNNIGSAKVLTAIPLDESLESILEKIVKTLSKKEKIDLEKVVDKEIIGGFVLKVGDKQIDASIKSKLKSLKVKFNENPFVKEF